MSIFTPRWLRRIVRRHTNPIQQNSAEVWKRRLSLAYGLLAWNAFGLTCYMIYTGKSDWAKHHGLKSEEELSMTPAQHFSKILNIEKGKIIRVSGFRKVDETEFYNEDQK